MRAGLVRKMVLFLVVVFSASSVLALSINKLPPDNWAAPATWSPTKSHVGLTTLGDVTQVLPFIGLDPCRIADTRNPTGPYGAPPLAGGVPRNFTLVGQCGIIAAAQVVSLNITVTNTAGPGFILIYPAGGAQPTVSTLNYVAGQTVANAAIVPLGAGGAVTVIAGVSGTNLIIDTNGYFPVGNSGSLVNPGEHFEVAGNETGLFGLITGRNNSAAVNTRGILGISVDLSTNSDSWTHTAGRFESVSGNGAIGLTNSLGSCGVIGAQYSGTGVNVSRGLLACDGNGLEAFSFGTSGVLFGVTGNTQSLSSGAAGVKGTSVGGLTNVFGGALGVLGNDGTASGIGVLGISRNRGINGARVDVAGALQASGVVGYSGNSGLHSFNDITAGGTKFFIQPHPFDPSKQIGYVSLEGNEAGTYFRGRGRFVNGRAVIPVPEDFQMVTEDDGLTVQITPLGRMAQVGVVSMDLNHIVAEGSRDVEFSYLVQGVRRGYASLKPIQDNVYFVPASADAKMDPWPQQVKDTLIRLGIYNADGTVNMETAERFGWAKAWTEAAQRDVAAANARPETEGGGQK